MPISPSARRGMSPRRGRSRASSCSGSPRTASRPRRQRGAGRGRSASTPWSNPSFRRIPRNGRRDPERTPSQPNGPKVARPKIAEAKPRGPDEAEAAQAGSAVGLRGEGRGRATSAPRGTASPGAGLGAGGRRRRRRSSSARQRGSSIVFQRRRPGFSALTRAGWRRARRRSRASQLRLEVGLACWRRGRPRRARASRRRRSSSAAWRSASARRSASSGGREVLGRAVVGADRGDEVAGGVLADPLVLVA